LASRIRSRLELVPVVVTDSAELSRRVRIVRSAFCCGAAAIIAHLVHSKRIHEEGKPMRSTHQMPARSLRCQAIALHQPSRQQYSLAVCLHSVSLALQFQH
jgi:hypothetical protein